jgi:hypothetical protein
LALGVNGFATAFGISSFFFRMGRSSHVRRILSAANMALWMATSAYKRRQRAFAPTELALQLVGAQGQIST